MTRLLLLDGDVFAYRYAAAGQRTFDWGDDSPPSTVADLDQAVGNMLNEIEWITHELGGDEVIVCLSDDNHSWRRERVYPQYKMNRKDMARPVALSAVKAAMSDHYMVKTKALLEADDVMGIIATNPKLYPGTEKVIVSRDKDMLTIPGTVAIITSADAIVEHRITEEFANQRHMIQTLQGDPVDGYPGCKGIGAVKAVRIAQLGWDAVRSTFMERGHDEDHFLAMARCARILRHEDYDYKNKEPKLWTPPSPD